MKKTVILTALLTTLLAQHHARGQTIGPSTLNASGGTAAISGNTYDWSIAEMTVVSTYTGSNLVVTQGLLQPYSDTSLNVTQTQGILQNLLVFPNPASSVVNLQYTSQVPGKMNYTLLDATGRTVMLKSVPVTQGRTSEQINISSLAAATYFLKVSFNLDGMTEQGTSYKIQKLN